MLSPFQLRWGIDQWVEFLKDKEIPVLPRTHALMTVLGEQSRETSDMISARELSGYVYADPYLALKLLRHAEGRRTQRLGQETTTALGAVLQTGFDDLLQVGVRQHQVLEDIAGREIPQDLISKGRNIDARPVAKNQRGAFPRVPGQCNGLTYRRTKWRWRRCCRRAASCCSGTLPRSCP